MLRRADEEYVEDQMRRVSNLDEELDMRQMALRRIDHIEETTITDQHRRSNQIDQMSYFWGGPEAVRYMQQSSDGYLGAMKSIRSGVAAAYDELDAEIRQLRKRKETLQDDIDHIQRTRQITDEGSSDVI